MPGRNSQEVYLCDTMTNLVCVHFWNSLGDYGYDSLLQNRAVANPKTDILYFRNLQWRSSSK